MPQHEAKRCERCNTVFECKPGDITNCQCFGIELRDAARQYIAIHYHDCICRKCLLQLNEETVKA